MMKKVPLLFVFIICLLGRVNAQYEMNVLTDHQIKGPVKVFVENEEQGQGYDRQIKLYEFDKERKIIGFRRFYPKGNDQKIKINDSTTINYFEAINSSYNGIDTNEFDLGSKSIYEYNEKKLLIKLTDFDEDDSIQSFYTYKYDLNDSLIEETHYEKRHNKDSLLYSTKYLYHQYENYYEKLVLHSPSNDWDAKFVIYVDEHKFPVKKLVYRFVQDEFKLKNVYQYSYNKNQLLIKEEFFEYLEKYDSLFVLSVKEYSYNSKKQLKLEKVKKYNQRYDSSADVISDEEFTANYYKRGRLNKKITKRYNYFESKLFSSNIESCFFDKNENATTVNVISKYVDENDKQVVEVHKFDVSYIYDKYNNWVYCKELYTSTSRSQREEVIYRQIIYWE